MKSERIGRYTILWTLGFKHYSIFDHYAGDMMNGDCTFSTLEEAVSWCLNNQ